VRLEDRHLKRLLDTVAGEGVTTSEWLRQAIKEKLDRAERVAAERPSCSPAHARSSGPAHATPRPTMARPGWSNAT
jgi:hypothetical protein